MRSVLFILPLLTCFVGPAPRASAESLMQVDLLTLSFYGITNNSAVSTAIGEAQLFVDVFEIYGSPNHVGFHFRNNGLDESSIARIYFEDGTLVDITEINNGPDVQFSEAAKPKKLPGQNNADPPFYTTVEFNASAYPSPKPNDGVQPGEWVEIIIKLLYGQKVSDVIEALHKNPSESGSLRIGMHVIGFANGESESFVNNPPTPDNGGNGDDPSPGPGIVPEPSSWLLFGCGAMALFGYVRRHQRKA